MATNYYTNLLGVVASGVGVSESTQVSYTVNDDLQTRKSGLGTYITCSYCGDRTREVELTSENCCDTWNSFIAGLGDFEFTLDEVDCGVGVGTDRTFYLGQSCGSTFSFSADGSTVVEFSATFGLVGDPPQFNGSPSDLINPPWHN